MSQMDEVFISIHALIVAFPCDQQRMAVKQYKQKQ